MGDRERWSKLPSWCCGYTEQSQRAPGPHRGAAAAMERCPLSSLPPTLRPGVGLRPGGRVWPLHSVLRGPPAGMLQAEPRSQAQGSSLGGGARFGVQHCVQKGPVEMPSCYLGTVVYGQLSPLHRAGRWTTEAGTVPRMGVGDILMREKGWVGRAFSGGCSACGDT